MAPTTFPALADRSDHQLIHARMSNYRHFQDASTPAIFDMAIRATSQEIHQMEQSWNGCHKVAMATVLCDQ